MESAKPVKVNKTADKKAYMREYMRNRYNANKDAARLYRSSLRLKGSVDLPSEEIKEFGIYLADVIKLKKLLTNLPPDVFQKVLETHQTQNI
jgi:hypothetical protein